MLTSFEQMNDEEAAFADNFFMEKVYPVLTPDGCRCIKTISVNQKLSH